MTVAAFVALVGISLGSGYAGIRSGEIPSIKIGRRVLVPTAAVRRMLQLDAAPALASDADSMTAPDDDSATERRTATPEPPPMTASAAPQPRSIRRGRWPA